MRSARSAKKVTAIVSDYDGTLCPINRVGSDISGRNEIPSELAQVLMQISESIPICVLSRKDYRFLYYRIPFAKIFSCIAGIETLVMAENNDVQQPRRISSRHLLVDEKLLLTTTIALDQLADDVASKFPSIKVERKFTVDGILSGLTFDWRHLEDWNRYKFAVGNYVKEVVSCEPYCHPTQLYVQEYQAHPFVDVYPVEFNKGLGFECVKIDVYPYSKDFPQKILYLGDSDSDNQAFKKADISIGVVSDERTANTNLLCNYKLKFDRLASFLQRLRNNNFVFSKSIL